MYHVFFIHSSVDGHLGCFHVSAIVNSAVVYTGVHASFQKLELSLDMCPGVGLVDHMVVLFLIFSGSSILFSIVAAAIFHSH